MNIREAKLKDASLIAKVHVDCWQTTYQGLLPNEYIQKRSYEKRLRNWKKRLDINAREKGNYFTYVAEVAGEVVGFIDGGLTRGDWEIYKGEIYALYILKAYQRRGIGKSLVRVIASRLFELGLSSIMVVVLEGNPSVRFYQSLGGQRIGHKTLKVDNDEFREIVYGWGDTKILFAH